MVKASLAQQDLKFTSQMYLVCMRARWRIQTWFAGLKLSWPIAAMRLVQSPAWSDEPFSSAEGRLLQTIRSPSPMGTDCSNQCWLSDYGRTDNSHSPAYRLHRTPSLRVSWLPRCHASFLFVLSRGKAVWKAYKKAVPGWVTAASPHFQRFFFYVLFSFND